MATFLFLQSLQGQEWLHSSFCNPFSLLVPSAVILVSSQMGTFWSYLNSITAMFLPLLVPCAVISSGFQMAMFLSIPCSFTALVLFPSYFTSSILNGYTPLLHFRILNGYAPLPALPCLCWFHLLLSLPIPKWLRSRAH